MNKEEQLQLSSEFLEGFIGFTDAELKVASRLPPKDPEMLLNLGLVLVYILCRVF